MKQHRIFTKEMVIDAAFELLRTSGWGAVTAREIAARLGSSTMPIYSHMKSLEELTQQLASKSTELLTEYQRRSYTPRQMFNIAVGYVAFARDEPRLFRFLFLDRESPASASSGAEMYRHFHQQFDTGSPEGEALALLSREAQEGLMRNSYIYTHGLAVLVHSSPPEAWSDETILTCLQDAGEAFFLLEQQRIPE